jgi:hypothetical protein
MVNNRPDDRCVKNQPPLRCLSAKAFEKEDCVQFRLLYSGRVLGASRTDTRATLKHEIRRSFHPQLRRLWENNESLLGILRSRGDEEASNRIFRLPNFDKPLKEEQRQRLENKNLNLARGKELVANEWKRCGYRFFPLVTESFCLRCSVDILFS